MSLALAFALWAVIFTQWRILLNCFGTLAASAARFAGALDELSQHKDPTTPPILTYVRWHDR